MPQPHAEVGAALSPLEASGSPLLRASGQKAPWRWIVLLTALGVFLRALLARDAMPLDIQSDEANYIYFALGLERFGIFFDQHRYFWPPGYSWLISKFISPESGVAGLDVLRGFQVLLSSVIGTTTMLFAWRLFSTRAAIAAGGLWAVYLPLAAFTHMLWTESVFLALFLPALWHLLVGMDRASRSDGAQATGRLLLSGALFGVALYIKELPLYLVPAAGLLVFFRGIAESAGSLESLRRALIVPLTALVILTPWTLRNQEVYGRTVLSGATLGENVYVGLNARYLNFDTTPLRRLRASLKLPQVDTYTRQAFVAPPASWVPADTNEDGSIDARDAAWPRAEDVPHAIDRQGVQIGRGLSYALANPVWTVRTRLKKWADLVAPMSFFTRHHALSKYPPGSALAGPARRPSILIAALESALVMLLGLAGLFFTLQRGPGRQLLCLLFFYVAVTSSLTAISRFRVPIEPFLIVLSGGFLAHGWAGPGNARMGAVRVAAFAVCSMILFGLWWISAPETIMQLEMGMAGLGDGS